MKKSHKMNILFVVLATILINISCAKSVDDNFYIIIANNTIPNFPQIKEYNPKPSKRQENVNELINEDNKFISYLVDEIHNLIIENKDTFKNVTKFESIEEEATLRKRDTEEHYIYDYGESNYVYPIGSTENVTFINAYLSDKIIDEVKNMEGVMFVNPVGKLIPDQNADIRRETKWKTVNSKSKAAPQLAMISQGLYNKDLVVDYDFTYYYSTLAGKDVDIYMCDFGFDFTKIEFDDNTREHRCVATVENGKAIAINKKICKTSEGSTGHGTEMAYMAGGKFSGVSRANIYGVNLSTLGIDDIIGGLEFVYNQLLKNPSRRNRTIINYACHIGIGSKEDNHYKLWDELVDKVVALGGIIFASAGNDNANVRNGSATKYPCCFGNVICVSGASDVVDYGKSNFVPKNYNKADGADYGDEVEIYAPYYATFQIYDEKKKGQYTITTGGTSYSVSIVSGLAANIISQYSNEKFDTNLMLKYLKVMGHKDVPMKGAYLINNGKKGVLSKSGKYYSNTCGLQAGYRSCPSGQCCGSDGKCYKSTSEKCKTKNGCQVDYGYCEITNSSNADGKCGVGYGNCKSGYCCSPFGYCGKTSEHCSFFCQTNFGHCE